MLLVDHQIRALCTKPIKRTLCRDEGFYDCDVYETNVGHRYKFVKNPMISPFSESVSGKGIVSYGLDHAGYCLRLGDEIWVAKNTYGEIVDPRRMKEEGYSDKIYDKIKVSDSYILPPHSYVLGKTLEYFYIPRFLKGRIVGKSTLARCGIIINCTPAEPGWDGMLVIEIANTSPLPIVLRKGEGIAQMEVEVLDSEPEVDYGQKNDGVGGIYQSQTGVTPARVRE